MAEGEVSEVREKNEKGKGSLCPHQDPYGRIYFIGVGDRSNYCISPRTMTNLEFLRNAVIYIKLKVKRRKAIYK